MFEKMTKEQERKEPEQTQEQKLYLGIDFDLMLVLLLPTVCIGGLLLIGGLLAFFIFLGE